MNNNIHRQSDTDKVKILREWERYLSPACGQGQLKLIHTISSSGGLSNKKDKTVDSPFAQKPLSELFSTWDVISCSCVAAHALNHTLYGKGALAIHLNLVVPIQNILGTHAHDVWFNNHAGKEGSSPTGRLVDSGALAEAIWTGTPKILPGKKPFPMKGSYDTLRRVDVITRGFSVPNPRYNEILVIGRPGLNLYTGLPVTGRIQLDSISFRPDYAFQALNSGHIPKDIENRIVEDLALIRSVAIQNKLAGFVYTYGNTKLYNMPQRNSHMEKLIREAGFTPLTPDSNRYKLSPTKTQARPHNHPRPYSTLV